MNRIVGNSLGFGVERLGLVALARPVLAALVLVAVTVAAGFGILRIQVDDSLSQLFRADTAEFRQFEALSSRFPSSEFDVLVVVEGPNLLERDSLERLREAILDLQLLKGVEGLISFFSARQPPRAGEVPDPLIPDELPEGEAFRELQQRILTNEIIRGKLLSEDGQLALIVIALDRGVAESAGLREVVGEVRSTVESQLAGSGLRTQLSGAPVMQLEIRNALERDRLLYNSLGFLAGCLIAALFFRRLSFMIIAAVPPLVGIVWSLGLLGWLDFRLNMFLNVMTPLVVVLGFSDSMQLTYAVRERLVAGEAKLDAIRNALLTVGPACVLTSAAAALSFCALVVSESHLIRSFGMAAALAALVTFLAVIVLQPLLGLFLLRGEAAFAQKVKGADGALNALRFFCGGLAERMAGRPRLYTLLSLVVVAALTVVYFTLEPRYRLADQVPDREQAVAAGARLDAKLSGANPVHVLVEFPPGASLYAPETLGTIADVHRVVETEAGIGNVWSIETLRRWLAERAGITEIRVLQAYVRVLPEHLTRRFVSVQEDAVVVTGRIPDVDASQLLPVVDRLDRALAPVRQQHPGYTVSVTGLSAIAARNSAAMIQNLSISLTGTMGLAVILLGIAFRSYRVPLVAILPGLFPIVSAGALLWILGEGLQFASVVALTVAFGLALSATIHYLNRLRMERRPDETAPEAVRRATVLVGPALILTTLVLAFGLGVTMISDLPSLRLFGWLSGFVLIAALVGNLLILPANVAALRSGVR